MRRIHEGESQLCKTMCMRIVQSFFVKKKTCLGHQANFERSLSAWSMICNKSRLNTMTVLRHTDVASKPEKQTKLLQQTHCMLSFATLPNKVSDWQHNQVLHKSESSHHMTTSDQM